MMNLYVNYVIYFVCSFYGSLCNLSNVWVLYINLYKYLMMFFVEQFSIQYSIQYNFI